MDDDVRKAPVAIRMAEWWILLRILKTDVDVEALIKFGSYQA